jgi:ribosomal protein S18 acetylase RimI-like enzyme
MKYIPLTMVREHMDAIPVFACPAGYHLRTYVPGDERVWAAIETAAGEFADEQEGHARFLEDYGAALDDVRDRLFFLLNEHGRAIGTATAWYGELDGQVRGRVHWVGIVPAEQGKKLAKPLLSAVMARLALDHPSAYLTTQTTSWRAVNLYLDFGFVPYGVDAAAAEGWALMEQALRRKIL